MAGYTPPAIWFSKPSATSLFIGTESVIANTTGSPVNVGLYAGENGTTGHPVNIGYFAGRANTTGNPVNVGYYAGENGTTGDSTMVGLETGRYVTNGTGFCLFGKYAGRALTTGSSNVSIFGEVPGEVGMTDTLILGTGSTTRFRFDLTNGYQFPSASATAGTITPTHTVTLSFNGTKYKIPCVAA